MSSAELALTAEELHCLAAMAGLAQVTGLGPMPFGDRPDVEPLLLGTALRSLRARGLLDEEVPGDYVEPASSVLEVLAVIGSPERAAVLQRGGAGGIGVRSFWVRGEAGVTLRRVAEHDYELVSFSGSELAERVLAAAELAGAVNGTAPPGEGARVARAALLGALAGSPAPGLPPLEDATMWELTWVSGDADAASGASLSWLDGGAAGAWRVSADDDEDASDGVVSLEPVSRSALASQLRSALG